MAMACGCNKKLQVQRSSTRKTLRRRCQWCYSLRQAQDTTQYVYALGTRPLAQYGGAWEYLLADALGSVRQIVDGNGNVTWPNRMSRMAAVLTSTGTASSIFGYSGSNSPHFSATSALGNG